MKHSECSNCTHQEYKFYKLYEFEVRSRHKKGKWTAWHGGELTQVIYDMFKVTVPPLKIRRTFEHSEYEYRRRIE